MYYWIQAGFELRGDVRRIAIEQLDLLRHHLSPAAPDPNESVHEARRALRRLRALLVLFRDELGAAYEGARAPYRACTQALSKQRDAQALVEALRRAREAHPGALPASLYRELDARLRQRRDRRLATTGPDRPAMRRVLSRARRQLDAWTSRASIELLRHGLKRRYRRGREALSRADHRDLIEATHELRRRSRELGLHYQLLQSLFPGLTRSGIRRAHKLAALLGRERELRQLRQALRRMTHDSKRQPTVARLLARLETERARRHEEALGLARRVYDVRPARFARHLEDLATRP